MITADEFLSIVKEKSRKYIADSENVWDMSIEDDLGLDSIVIVSILVEIEERANTQFSFENLKRIDVTTLRKLWEFIGEAIGQKN